MIYVPRLKPILGAPINKVVARRLGLVGLWWMNQGGGNLILDSSGNRSTGTAVGTPAWIVGEFGKALAFNGTTDYYTMNPFPLRRRQH